MLFGLVSVSVTVFVLMFVNAMLAWCVSIPIFAEQSPLNQILVQLVDAMHGIFMCQCQWLVKCHLSTSGTKFLGKPRWKETVLQLHLASADHQTREVPTEHRTCQFGEQ